MAVPFLRRIADRINAELSAAQKIAADMIEADIKARRHDAAAAQIWSDNRDRIIKECDRLGITEVKWCKDYLAHGNSYSRMRLRVRLLQGFDRYLELRPKHEGVYSLEFAAFLASDEHSTNCRRASVLTGTGVIDPSR